MHTIHLRCCVKEDQDLDRNNPNVYFAISLDLEKALPFLKLSVYMYVWNETVTSRISQEVESCILKNLKNLKIRNIA